MSRNTFVECGDFVIGYTTKGEKFTFDREFLPLIMQCTWSIGSHGYLQGAIDGQMCLMHRIIMNCPNTKIIDHINHDKTDNRKQNLRICDQHRNQMNEQLSKNSTSGVTGVHYYKSRNKWTAQIGVNKKMIHLGYFENFDDAVKARKEAEEHYYGSFSYDNSQKFSRDKE